MNLENLSIYNLYPINAIFVRSNSSFTYIPIRSYSCFICIPIKSNSYFTSIPMKSCITFVHIIPNSCFTSTCLDLVLNTFKLTISNYRKFCSSSFTHVGGREVIFWFNERIKEIIGICSNELSFGLLN